jgi:hypothetical protein
LTPPQIKRKTLVPNEKQLSAEVGKELLSFKVGATRRLLNFFWPVWAVGTPSCGDGWMTENQPRNDVADNWTYPNPVRHEICAFDHTPRRWYCASFVNAHN